MIKIKINETPIYVNSNTKDVTFKVYFKEPPDLTNTECYGDTNQNRVITTIPTITNNGNTLNLINTISYSINYTTRDNLGVWLDFSTTINETTTIDFVDLYLELNGESDCQCDYDVLIKDVEIIEISEYTNIITIPPIGFNYNKLGDETLDGLQRVIDNKKSWVYNPGRPKYGIKEFDDITRTQGDFGLIDGHGNLNRKFSPSEGAELTYRTTNYLEQSSILEKHSDLVINSKEMFMTFNMKPLDKFCPNGYSILSGNTCSNGNNTQEAIPISLINLEQYKKTFQSFWIRLVEQFVPATTIFVSAEKWTNNLEDICEELSECDLDNELTSVDISAFIGNDSLATMSFEFNESTCIGCLGGGSELQRTVTEIETVISESGTTKNNSIDKSIYFDGFTLISLEEDRTNIITTSGDMVISDLEQRRDDMFSYRDRLTVTKEETIFE